MQGPFYASKSFLYNSSFFDPEVPYYNNTRYHRKPSPRQFPDNRPYDDGTEYKEDTSVNDTGEVLRQELPNVLNMETWIEKRLKVVLYGVKAEDDQEFTLEIGKRYAISYITESGLKTADGYLRFLSTSIPEECVRYAGNYSDAAMQSFIGMDCSKKGISDKRKIYINTIRAITELEDDEDYEAPAVVGTINDLLQLLLKKIGYLESDCCPAMIEKVNSIMEDVQTIKEENQTLVDLDRNGDGVVDEDELFFVDIGDDEDTSTDNTDSDGE